MLAHLGRAPLVTPPALDFGNLAASYQPHPQAPFNVRFEGTLSYSSACARVPAPSSVRHRSPFVMAGDIAGVALLFFTAQGHLPEILVVKNSGPCLVELGKALSTTVAPETFGVTV